MSTENTLTTQPASGTLPSLMQAAMQSGADPAYLRELLAVREQWEASEARKAFNLAVSDFQKRSPIIEKLDLAHDKHYARMDRIWREIRPLVTELGLSVTWQICELRGELCHVEGRLAHRDGHGERLVMDIPMPEAIRGQNEAQRMGSANTYARRYAMCAALGIVTGSDDDANAAGKRLITYTQGQELELLISACKGLPDFNEPAFWKWAGAESVGDIEAVRFSDLKKGLETKLKGVKK